MLLNGVHNEEERKRGHWGRPYVFIEAMVGQKIWALEAAQKPVRIQKPGSQQSVLNIWTIITKLSICFSARCQQWSIITKLSTKQIRAHNWAPE